MFYPNWHLYCLFSNWDLTTLSILESGIKKKNLTAVDRYRLRKRNPFPASIWEGEKTIYCLKKSARDSLTNFFERNPYPTPAEKRRLATSCELSYVQISNWFKNKRMREKESNRLKWNSQSRAGPALNIRSRTSGTMKSRKFKF